MALALALVLATGVGLGLLGGGGSLLVLPVLTQVLGQSAHEATTASLVIVTLAALAAGAGHARQRRVCWRHAALFTAASLPAIVAGTALADALPGEALLVSFAALMLAAAAALASRHALRAAPATSSPCPAAGPAQSGALGAVVGLLTGLLGVGGGFIVVPALALFLRMPLRSAIGTSLAVVTATGLAGIAVHLLSGRPLDPGVTAALTATMALGALAGARLSRRVPEPALASALAGVLTVVAAYLVVSVAALGSSA
jgi:hypothetical protein